MARYCFPGVLGEVLPAPDIVDARFRDLLLRRFAQDCCLDGRRGGDVQHSSRADNRIIGIRDAQLVKRNPRPRILLRIPPYGPSLWPREAIVALLPIPVLKSRISRNMSPPAVRIAALRPPELLLVAWGSTDIPESHPATPWCDIMVYLRAEHAVFCVQRKPAYDCDAIREI